MKIVEALPVAIAVAWVSLLFLAILPNDYGYVVRVQRWRLRVSRRVRWTRTAGFAPRAVWCALAVNIALLSTSPFFYFDHYTEASAGAYGAMILGYLIDWWAVGRGFVVVWLVSQGDHAYIAKSEALLTMRAAIRHSQAPAELPDDLVGKVRRETFIVPAESYNPERMDELKGSIILA